MTRVRSHTALGAFLSLSWAVLLAGDLTRPARTSTERELARLVTYACTGTMPAAETVQLRPESIERFGDIAQAAKEALLRYPLEPELLLAVMAQESRCVSHARSARGAIGLMQLMPATARAMGAEKPEMTRENILAGARYLKTLSDQFKGDRKLVLAAYNAGPGAVRKFKKVPPYKETTRYIDKVLGHYKTLNEARAREAAPGTGSSGALAG